MFNGTPATRFPHNENPLGRDGLRNSRVGEGKALFQKLFPSSDKHQKLRAGFEHPFEGSLSRSGILAGHGDGIRVPGNDAFQCVAQLLRRDFRHVGTGAGTQGFHADAAFLLTGEAFHQIDFRADINMCPVRRIPDDAAHS